MPQTLRKQRLLSRLARTGLVLLAACILLSQVALYHSQARQERAWQRDYLSGFVRNFKRLYSDAMTAHLTAPNLLEFMLRSQRCLTPRDLAYWSQLLDLDSVRHLAEQQSLEVLGPDAALPSPDNAQYPDIDIRDGALHMLSRVPIGRQCRGGAPVLLRLETQTEPIQAEQPYEHQLAGVGEQRLLGQLALKGRDDRWFGFAALAQSGRISFSRDDSRPPIPAELLANPFSRSAEARLQHEQRLFLAEHDPYTGASFVFLSPPLDAGFLPQFIQRNLLQLALSAALLLALLCIERFIQHSMRTALRLQRLATRDPLTGILNRRAFLVQGAQEVARAARSGSSFALLQIDIDHFKRINDTHGHPCGDAALVFFTGVLSQVARQQDVLARIGGEEFVVLMPDTPLQGAEQLAGRILKELQATPLHYQALELHLTCSFGVTAWLGPRDSLEDMLMRGDRLLYQAKRNGRARFESQGADAGLPSAG